MWLPAVRTARVAAPLHARSGACAPCRAVRAMGDAQGPAKRKSKHALMYREIFPPLIRVLAYSTATYFGLHLAWLLLEQRESGASQRAEIDALQADVRERVTVSASR